MSDNLENFNSVYKYQFYLDFETCMKTHQLCIHQEAEEDSDSEGTAGSTLDSTYECISSLPPTVAPTVKEGMNDTMVLVARLDNAGLDSPAPALNSNSPVNSRFTFVTKGSRHKTSSKPRRCANIVTLAKLRVTDSPT